MPPEAGGGPRSQHKGHTALNDNVGQADVRPLRVHRRPPGPSLPTPGGPGPGSHPGGVLGQRPCDWRQGRPRGAPPVGGCSLTRKPVDPPGGCTVAAHGGHAFPCPCPTGAHCQPGASCCPLAPVGAAGTFSQGTRSGRPCRHCPRLGRPSAPLAAGGGLGRPRHEREGRRAQSRPRPGTAGRQWPLCRALPDATGSRARDAGTGEGCRDLPSVRARLQVGGRRQLASPLGGCFQPSPCGQTPAVPPGSGGGDSPLSQAWAPVPGLPASREELEPGGGQPFSGLHTATAGAGCCSAEARDRREHGPLAAPATPTAGPVPAAGSPSVRGRARSVGSPGHWGRPRPPGHLPRPVLRAPCSRRDGGWPCWPGQLGGAAERSLGGGGRPGTAPLRA